MIFEFSFDPTAYEDQRALGIKDISNTLTIVLVNNSSLLVDGIRVINIPKNFVELVLPYWENAFEVPNYGLVYSSWYQTLQTKTLEEFWKGAKPFGFLGLS